MCQNMINNATQKAQLFHQLLPHVVHKPIIFDLKCCECNEYMQKAWSKGINVLYYMLRNFSRENLELELDLGLETNPKIGALQKLVQLFI